MIERINVCVANKFYVLCDRRDELCKSLAAQGFEDIFFYEELEYSFAGSEDELELSKKIRIELARRMAWRDCLLNGKTIALPGESAKPPFDGNWLDVLLQERKKMLYEAGEVERANSLSVLDLDPCRVRREEWEGLSYENARHMAIDVREHRLLLRDKIAQSGLVNVLEVSDEPESIRNYIADQLLSGLEGFNFKRVKKSDKSRVSVVRKISQDLELRFCVSDFRWSFSKFGWRGFGPSQEWDCTPNGLELSLGLHVRSERTKRFGDVPDVVIPLQHLAPFRVHGHYRNAAHIAVAVGGWMALYRMIANNIDDLCVACWKQSQCNV